MRTRSTTLPGTTKHLFTKLLCTLALVFAFAPAAQAQSEREQTNERVARQFFDNVVNSYAFNRASGYASRWVVQHSPPGNDRAIGIDAFRETYETLKTAFPDYQFDVKEVVSERNKVAVRYVFTGTNEGELLGMEATGKKVSTWGVAYMRIEAGKIRETWGTPLTANLLDDLGVFDEKQPAVQ